MIQNYATDWDNVQHFSCMVPLVPAKHTNVKNKPAHSPSATTQLLEAIAILQIYTFTNYHTPHAAKLWVLWLCP